MLPVLLLLASTLPARSEPPPLFEVDVQRAMCADRKACKVVEITRAGLDPSGRPLAVAKLSLPRTSMEDAAVQCDPFEYWSLTWDKARVTPLQYLLYVCNDGYGASGVGEDQVEVTSNRMSWSRVGGSNWRWGADATVQLSPPRVLSEGHSGFWTGDALHTEDAWWSWESGTGGTAWWAPPCDEKGDPDYTHVAADASVPDDQMYRFLALPQVTLPEVFRSSAWRTTSLGTCGVRVDATGKEGFLVHGEPGEATDASFTAVLADPRELYVEVTDDKLVETGERPAFADHLEIWTGTPATYAEVCVQKDTSPRQWMIAVNGAVTPGWGHPSPLAVTRTLHGNSIRFRVTLPDDVDALTVVWSDSDDGLTQERLLATSRLQPGQGPTLGRPFRIDPDRASCRVVDGRLDLVDDRQLGRGEPLVVTP